LRYELDARFGRENRYVNELVLEAMLNKGSILLSLWPRDTELILAVFRKVIERAGKEGADYAKSAADVAQETIEHILFPFD
jgi:hypothetical protein